MVSALQEDLAKLDALAYRRREAEEEDLRRYYALLRKGKKVVAPVEALHRWMLIPCTLWPVDIHSLFCVCLDTFEDGAPMDEEMQFLLRHLPEPPSAEVCRVVAEHEHLVWKGGYESLVNSASKFDAEQKKAERNPELLREWEEIKAQWDTSRHTDHKGIIRRSLSGERNLKETFCVNWLEPDQRFQAAFDFFCLRWHLYGMEGDKPLVVKLSVNLTAHGMMMFIPSYWSFDASRDVKWPEVMKLHKARSLKQGKALAEGYDQRRSDAAKLHKLDTEARCLKLRGEALHEFLCKGLKLDKGTDPKRLARLRKEFPSP